MNHDTQRQMTSWNVHEGDRIDAVAQVCRRLYLRTELCPCMTQLCMQCKNDLLTIEAAWLASMPTE